MLNDVCAQLTVAHDRRLHRQRARLGSRYRGQHVDRAVGKRSHERSQRWHRQRGSLIDGGDPHGAGHFVFRDRVAHGDRKRRPAGLIGLHLKGASARVHGHPRRTLLHRSIDQLERAGAAGHSLERTHEGGLTDLHCHR